MRFRTKLFAASSCVVLALWAASLWPIERMIASSFERMAESSFTGTRQSLQSLRAEHVSRMRQAGRMLMQIPELRALIAEHRFEVSAENMTSLTERLDSLSHVLDVSFICVLDADGGLIAQNDTSPWATIQEAQEYIRRTPQSKSLVSRLFGPATERASDRGQHGQWLYRGRLYEVMGLPLVFGDDSRATPGSDGALIMAAPVTDDLAKHLSTAHQCEITFVADGVASASSLEPTWRKELLDLYARNRWPESSPFDVQFGAVTLRSYIEPVIDPCSGTSVGAMVIQSTMTDGQALQNGVWYRLFGIVSGGLLAAGVLSYLISGAITKPVKQLVQGAKQVANGDLTSSIDAGNSDEFGQLAVAFNEMVVQIRTRRELELLVEESRAASEAKGRFLANMSHEIRTPLHGIVGMANLLLDTKLDERQRHFAELVRSSSEVLGRLINDVLDFSKIEAGKLELEMTEFEPRSVIEDVADLLAQQASKKGVEIVVDIPDDVPELALGDSNRLRQILMNLVGNAVKFTQQGEIVLRASALAADAGGTLLRLEISDTGIGIPDDKMNRLFRAFSQVDPSTTRKFGGTGLGLAISKQLAELMGGEIGVRSNSGRGTTFWFTVRLTVLRASMPPEQDRLSGLRIVVADRNAAARDVIRARLTDLGARVEVLGTSEEVGRALLQAAQTTEPVKLVLIERRMEGSRGIVAACSSLGSVAIALTTVSDAVAESELAAESFSSSVLKPVRTCRLRTTVLSALGLHLEGTEARTVSGEAPIEPIVGAPARILVAEDNEANQLVASGLLGKAGHTCVVVGDGASAVNAVRTQEFDLVFMDCQMPGMDGFEATRAIRQYERERSLVDPAVRPVPIVALTANASGADRERCQQSGMDAFCGKPFRPQELLAVVASFVNANRAGRGNLETNGDYGRFSPADEYGSTPIDIASLLARCAGDSKLAAAVLDKFELQVRTAITGLETGLMERDANLIERIAHGAKSTAGLVAADALHAALAEMEAVARSGLLDDGAGLLIRLREEIDRCCAYLPQAKAGLAQRLNEAA